MYDSEMNYGIVEYRPRRKKRGLVKLLTSVLLVCCFGLSVGFGFGISGLLTPSSSSDDASSGLDLASQEPAATLTWSTDGISFVNFELPANGVVDVVRQSASSVVSINLTGTSRDLFNRNRRFASAGSGIIIGETEDRLYIATNNHVIENASDVTISVDDSKQVTANYVGSEFETDLAVISVSKADMAGVPYSIAMVGNSDLMEVGEIVVAIGNAMGEGKTATMGIVSAKNRTISDEGRTLNLIQTDAAINSGNSGGALVNMNAEVIAINTAKLKGVGIEGMSYSLPINEAIKTITQLIENGTVEPRPYLGIQGMDIDEQLREQHSLPSIGIYVQGIIAGSAAEGAGLRRGDIIIGFGDKPIAVMEDLQAALGASKVGDTVRIMLYRNQAQYEISATLKAAGQKF